jgi:hypothetical protein
MKTSKKLLTFVFAHLAVVAIAQDHSTLTYPEYSPDIRNILTEGIVAGFNSSDVTVINGQNFTRNPLLGPAFGGFLSIPITTLLGVQPELLYSEKGYYGKGITGDGQDYYSFIDRMNYLDVPVTLQVKPSPYLYLLAGPEYSYLLSSNYSFLQDLTYANTQKEFENDNIRHNILGLIFGVDINYARIAFGIRAAWDITANSGNEASSLPRYRNTWEQFTIGYRI